MNNKCNWCDKEHEKYNTGCINSGDYNSGDYNSGNCNSGDFNSGNRNSGNRNSGDRNSGDFNSGDFNSGYRNSGDYNSGNYNSGYRNSGYYNSGYYNSGYFNTDEPKMRFFNKDSTVTYSEFSKGKMVYPDLKVCSWVNVDDLPQDEQTTEAKQLGGILKELSYKEAWAEYWNRASEADKEWFQNLPNFDAKIFEDITGINVAQNDIEEMTLKQVCKELGREVKIVKE